MGDGALRSLKEPGHLTLCQAHFRAPDAQLFSCVGISSCGHGGNHHDLLPLPRFNWSPLHAIARKFLYIEMRGGLVDMLGAVASRVNAAAHVQDRHGERRRAICRYANKMKHQRLTPFEALQRGPDPRTRVALARFAFCV